ncbi:hypothetical protein Tco_1099442 [Tanacetum coccineum]
MSPSKEQTLADSGTNERPPMLERGNYIPWVSRFRRFLDNTLEEGEQMWYSIQNGPYVRPMIPDPEGAQNQDGFVKQVIQPLSKMIEGEKKQYTANVRVMNYLLQAIPNEIYNSVDACQKLKKCRNELKAKEGELLQSVYKRLTTLMNIMDHNNVRPIPVNIASYDHLYDSLVQIEPHVLASKARKAAKNHDPLSFIAKSNASSSNSSYPPQPYYVTHPSSIVDYEDEYQGELQGDSQEDKSIITMMLLARATTQKFSTPTNNFLRTSLNTRNQAVIQDGRVDIQTKNAGYGGNGNKNAGR